MLPAMECRAYLVQQIPTELRMELLEVTALDHHAQYNEQLKGPGSTTAPIISDSRLLQEKGLFSSTICGNLPNAFILKTEPGHHENGFKFGDTK
jgi:hypothetical protein